MSISKMSNIMLVGAALLASTYSRAQAAPSIVHQHSADNISVIDGKDHPELIPDLTAYRLHLLSVARPAMPTPDEAKSQAIHLGMIKLSDKDNQAAVAILASFYAEYHRLIDEFNKRATTAYDQGKLVDPAVQKAFLAARDLLVQTTHDTLQSTLSTQGWQQWDDHVHQEKSKMQISQGGVK